MEVSMLYEAGQALLIMSDPTRLMFLASGVLIGLMLGVIPGLGGIVGMALLLPFTFDMDRYSAFAFLLGMGSVTTTSDTIPAVLFGVPGTAGSAATILDGHPLAKQGQAGRAFGAAYTASLIGGVFGAMLLAVSIPILRPVMLYLGSPELLAFAIFGLSMVAVLSGGAPLRGLAAAGFGLIIAMIGSDPQIGVLRWTMDTLYLWDGLPLVPVTIGLFALPELADMAIARRSIAGDAKVDSRRGQWQGVRDTFHHWWLVIRVAWLGASLGAIPGVGAAVIDWIAYGHAARTEKGASETFGKGDIRGVLASEGSNNAKEGGALVPTIAFGVPGSASMAILLGAFLIHGLVPGPDMLTRNLSVTYTMVWSVALANILGAGLCFMFSDQFAKVAVIRYAVIMPLILTVVFVGAFQGSRQWGDIYTLLFFGVLGWVMKRLGWPRPPLILGFVLGGLVERYLFISIQRYGGEWLLPQEFPVVTAVLALALYGVARPFIREVRRAGGLVGMFSKFSRPGFDIQTVFYAGFIALIGAMVFESRSWDFGAKIVPMTVGSFTVVVATASLLNYTFRKASAGGAGEGVEVDVKKSLHLDLKVEEQGMETRVMMGRAVTYLAWLLGFVALAALFGMLFAVFLFVILYMRIEGKERWALVLPLAFGLLIFTAVLFDELLALPWPQAVFGDFYLIFKEAAIDPFKRLVWETATGPISKLF